ncbi:hypothetical protein EVAR_28753_1 [Eumeta japonica]|uniref:Uncharacterized protein n=1 Tax=Eumeta variegata TaxID=151549 RepID=A0A4C1Z3N7_EUMVA|nr:hypothetical protein EVAR_28753_1 [Eumeta japonica]
MPNEARLPRYRFRSEYLQARDLQVVVQGDRCWATSPMERVAMALWPALLAAACAAAVEETVAEHRRLFPWEVTISQRQTRMMPNEVRLPRYRFRSEYLQAHDLQVVVQGDRCWATSPMERVAMAQPALLAAAAPPPSRDCGGPSEP